MSHETQRFYKAALLLFAAATVPRAAEQTLTIDSPAEYQVFQRNESNSASVLVSGHAPADCDRVEAELRGSWAALPLDPGRHTFRAELGAPAGGFYSLRVRAWRGKELREESAVAHVGVGEVFVIAGQSNATNYGEARQQTHSRMVTTFDGSRWRLADDPQPGVQDSSRTGSFIPPFGDALYERLRVPVGVACVGHGSTSVRQWLPKGGRMKSQPTMTRFVLPAGDGEWESTGQLFDGMMERIRELGPHGFRALLWHQGESDANQKAGHQISGEEYERMMRMVMEAARREAGWDFPWFVAQASYHTPEEPRGEAIRAAQSRLWRSGLALEGPDTDLLTGVNRQNGGTGVHFSDEGLKAHGRLWAEKVTAWLESQTK